MGGRHALMHRCGHTKALYSSQTNRCSTWKPRQAGSVSLNNVLGLQRKTQAALPSNQSSHLFSEQAIPSLTSCPHEICQPLLNLSQCHRQSRHAVAQSASRVNLHTTELISGLSPPCPAVKAHGRQYLALPPR